MKVTSVVWILSMLLGGMAWPASAQSVLANGPAGGTNGCVDDTWMATSTADVPSARSSHTAVWTGTEMIVWGGVYDDAYLNTGGRYDPVMNTWTAISRDGAPSARAGHTAVWTGTEMIVWGGRGDGPPYELNTGGRYDPATDTWTAISTDGAPSGRGGHTAVWTGMEMIVWGGAYVEGGRVVSLNTGGRYDPVTDSWIATSMVDAPSARETLTSVWTGTEMLVWGGAYCCSFTTLSTGGRYDPATDTWRATSMVDAPSARANHTAVWTGMEMIVWGGQGVPPPSHNTGGRYDPATDTWRATSMVDAPSARVAHTAVWTGSEMIVWGGRSYDGTRFVDVNTGGRYDPATGTWRATSMIGPPSGRVWPTAVWTDREMIVWAGTDRCDPNQCYGTNTGGRYCASAGSDGR